MYRSFIILAILCLVAPIAHGDDRQTQVPLAPKAGAYEIGSYRYVLTLIVTNDGRVTEVGSLFRDGLPIAGDDYFRLELSVGSFIWYPVNEQGRMFGWTRIDPDKKHSEWYMALMEPKPDRCANMWRTVMRDPIPGGDRSREDRPPSVDVKGPQRNQ